MKPTITAIERDLRLLLDGDVEFDAITRHLYATDASLYQIEPLGVVSPRGTEDVLRLVDYASKRGIPLVPRGTGSGLAGAAVGAGVQVDFTRYMNRLLEVSPDGEWARVQPGLVMGVLNQAVKKVGRFFAPNPASENFCTLGGMISNNASGSRSVAYGGTKDHVLELQMVLPNGTLYRVAPVPRGEEGLRALQASDPLAENGFSHLAELLLSKEQQIKDSMPFVVKNCSGYRLEAVLSDDELALQKLFVGAEGTLGLITEATLRLVPLPGHRAIAMTYFPSVFAAGDAVFPILGLKPTSLEIMDSSFLKLVRSHYPHVRDLIPQAADTALLIEFEAAQKDDLAEKVAALESELAGGPVLEIKPALDAPTQAQLWEVRKAAVPILQKLPGPKVITEFIEDVTVHPTVLARYMDELAGILSRYGVDWVMYGHAGDGNIHTRPLLDPKDAGDLVKMRSIMDEVLDVVLEIRGTPSGEHGDGLVRSRYVPRVYGEEVYGVFKQVKAAFDPSSIMNPGKKVLDPALDAGIAGSLRYGPNYWTFEQKPLLEYVERSFEAEIEKCHGCASCRNLVDTTMCPAYKATRREHATPRAKANLLRNIIQGKLDPADTYVRDEVKMVTDPCMECGMCRVECPSNVNVPKLTLELRAKYLQGHRPKAAELLLGHAELVSRASTLVSPLSGRLMNQHQLRRIADAAVGIDRRRTMPLASRKSFARTAQKRNPGGLDGRIRGKVAFFYDTFANYHDPDLAGIIVNLLEAHGLEVQHPAQRGSGVPEMLYGFIDSARDAVEFNVSKLAPLVREGLVIVSGEPTATLALREHYECYVNSEDCRAVAAATRDLGEFLAGIRSSGGADLPVPREMKLKVGYHQPCHLKAQRNASSFLDLLKEIPGMELVDLNAGCCGMAGTYGMKADRFDVSMKAGEALFQRIHALDPDLVVSECSTCRMQITQGTGKKTAHPAELFAKACGL